ncbi:MAG TPA: hypothetical protein VFS92_00815, partial [Planctomycetota bacterium]|nr:hypothetical protein [Planctomycetota bacterium]
MRKTPLAGLLVVAALAPTVRADDEAAVESAYQRANAHLKAERWSSAVDALKRLMADNPGSKAVLDRLDAIETDLRRAMYRLQAKHPDPTVLFCKHAKGFIINERRLTLEYPEGPVMPDWAIVGSSQSLAIPFDSDVAVEFRAPTIASKEKTIVEVWLHALDPKQTDRVAGSYHISPGACSEDAIYLYLQPGKVVRHDSEASAGGSKTRELVSKPVPGKVSIGQIQTYRVVRRGTGINVSVDGKAFLVCQDPKYPVVLVTISAAQVSALTVRGVVEKAHYLGRLEKWHVAEQANW